MAPLVWSGRVGDLAEAVFDETWAQFVHKRTANKVTPVRFGNKFSNRIAVDVMAQRTVAFNSHPL